MCEYLGLSHPLHRGDFLERVTSTEARKAQAEASVAGLRVNLEGLSERLVLAKDDHEAAMLRRRCTPATKKRRKRSTMMT